VLSWAEGWHNTCHEGHDEEEGNTKLVCTSALLHYAECGCSRKSLCIHNDKRNAHALPWSSQDSSPAITNRNRDTITTEMIWGEETEDTDAKNCTLVPGCSRTYPQESNTCTLAMDIQTNRDCKPSQCAARRTGSSGDTENQTYHMPAN
jgi:hypothetical protein